MTIAMNTSMSQCQPTANVSHAAAGTARGIEREHACELDGSVELLQTIADVLDIRTVFSRVSRLRTRCCRTTGWSWRSSIGRGISFVRRPRPTTFRIRHPGQADHGTA